MKCHPITAIGLVLGFVALLGGVPRLASAAGSAVSCPPQARPHVLHHHVVHHYVVHRYVSRTWYGAVWTPVGCGTTEHPCNVEHLTAPFQ
jgi:hypothetical protein